MPMDTSRCFLGNFGALSSNLKLPWLQRAPKTIVLGVYRESLGAKLWVVSRSQPLTPAGEGLVTYNMLSCFAGMQNLAALLDITLQFILRGAHYLSSRAKMVMVRSRSSWSKTVIVNGVISRSLITWLLAMMGSYVFPDPEPQETIRTQVPAAMGSLGTEWGLYRGLSSMHLSGVLIMLMSWTESEWGLYLSRLFCSLELELIWTISFLYICVLCSICLKCPMGTVIISINQSIISISALCLITTRDICACVWPWQCRRAAIRLVPFGMKRRYNSVYSKSPDPLPQV